MSRMAVTPCCGVVNSPSNPTVRAKYRTSLRLGICPLCDLDMTKPVNGDVQQARALVWFHTNAYLSATGGYIWQWSDDECFLFREVMKRYKDDEIDPTWESWVALEPYTGSLAIYVPLDDKESVLDIKRAGGWYNGVHSWRVEPAHQEILIEKLRARGYRILPSVELAALYRSRNMA